MVYVENITDEINPGVFYTIKIGQNQFENDKLVKDASVDNIWFHLSCLPSPHGILISNSKLNDIPRKILCRAAFLVKYHSKYSFLKNVKVDYITIKYVLPTDVTGEVDIKKKPKVISV